MTDEIRTSPLKRSRARRRIAWLAGMTALLATMPPAARAGDVCDPAQTIEPITLCGTTVIVASQPSIVRIRVSEESEVSGPAYLPGTEPPQASPYMGVIIKEDGFDGRFAHVGSFNRDHRGFFNDHRSGSFPNSPAGIPLLPPGEHTLYLITQPGVESTFELKLLEPGIGPRPGRIEIHPSRLAQLDFRVLPNLASGPAADAGVTYSAGTEFEWAPGRQAFAFFSTAMRGPFGLTLDNTCEYHDRPDTPMPYWPGCPTLNRPGTFNVVWGPHVLGEGTRITVNQWGYVDPWGATPQDRGGINAIGVWRKTVGENVHHSSLAWFLNFVN